MEDSKTTLLSTSKNSAARQSQSPSPSPAKQLGPIRLVRLIGHGGMGDVWLGRDDFLHRDVAVKILHGELIDRADPAFTAFIQGAAAASVNHPALNAIYHADVVDGFAFLVLELLDGHNLDEIIALSGPLELSPARAIIETAAAAVAELHQLDLLHRDLKPSNIVLRSDGRIVVTDFGLACARPAAAVRADAGTPAGTPAYMAPEMFDGIVSARTDVYALGITAYHLLCGRAPFQGSLDELRRQHQSAGIPLDPLLAANVPQPVIEVIARATNRDVLFRPKTARHLLDLFRAAFDASGIKSASADELAHLHNKWFSSPPSSNSPVPRPKSVGMFALLSDLARRKRNRPAIAPIADENHPHPFRQLSATESHQRQVERWRVRIATVFASLCAVCAGLATIAAFHRFDPIFRQFLNHRFGPRWVNLIQVIVPILAVNVCCVGTGASLYRLLRGKPLPPLLNHIACGWCGHELRGITQPLCPECGHAIGNPGPDEHGQFPPGFRGARRLMIPILLLTLFFPAITIVAIPLLIILRIVAPRSNAAIAGTGPLFIITWLAMMLVVAFYEAFLQFDLTHNGRCWCRTCGGELKNLKEPVCPLCGSRI